MPLSMPTHTLDRCFIRTTARSAAGLASDRERPAGSPSVTFPRILLAVGVIACLLAGFAMPDRCSAAEDWDAAWATPPTGTLRHPDSLETLLRAADPSDLVREVQERGDPRRGALVYYRSAAACSRCHGDGDAPNPLGPDLATLGDEVTAEQLIEAILLPSKRIRPGYETVSVLTEDGQLIAGMIIRQDEEQVVLRDATDLTKELRINRSEIEAIRPLETSLMPDGLIPVIGSQKAFYDLAAYVIGVARGGPAAATRWKPTPEELAITDDIENLDHAGIIRGLNRRDFTAGEAIYQGYCYSCHGLDGNTPSLATARAFGTQRLKYGEDPYRMFLTLSRGNGLMAPMTQLTPKERYQVVHYIREQFVKPGKLDETPIDTAYLEQLPQGNDSGERVLNVERDYGPALASQLGRRVNSALTISAGELTVSYNLHSLDLAGVWGGGFLKLDQTQHIRGRGEGTADPAGPLIAPLSFWRWGHDGTLDYPTEDLPPRGPMPAPWLDYHGHYLHGDRVVLSYAIDQREVFETVESLVRPEPAEGDDRADNEVNSDGRGIAQTLQIGPGSRLLLAIGRLDGYRITDAASDRSLRVSSAVGSSISMQRIDPTDSELPGHVGIGILGDRDGLTWRVDDQQRVVLEIPESDRSRRISILRWVGPSGELAAAKAWARLADAGGPAVADPEAWTAGGPARWETTPVTTGYLGLEPGGYALDTIPVPEVTPWNTWFRTSAIDFTADGRMVLATYGGDIWIVSQVTVDLRELRWKRFAAGLYEPMGVKVVNGRIHVTGKDRLTRLHDLNGNGEADFYESFAADPDVSVNFHAFNFDLQVDSQGFFYYSKSGHGADTDLPGVVYRISPDGKTRESLATGFRTPNGLGMLPDDRVTVSDNQGQWVPASKIDLLRRGGFYGWVQTYDGRGRWAPGGGTIDLKKVVPPTTFDRPLVYMPQVVDNSSGGQLWVDDPRWGPLSGKLLHTSFGRGWLFYLLTQDIEEVSQAAIIKLPLDFRTGIMRAAVNPADGQVYAVGLDGWNGGGRPGLLDHGIQRVRYTGKPHPIVSDCQVEPDGLRLSFNFPLDAAKATDPASYKIRHWNYFWQAAYGSEMYSPKTGKVGIDPVEVVDVELAADRRSVLLKIPNLRPVDQLQMLLRLADEAETPFAEEIYWTINRLPPK
ncbi:MAG: hypothetical protein EA381_19545 [Planctomycetaceae bacterium]|nr:MAG: hypothetical protein EA381_19545 [Planctomycetaceae bacterium]